MLHLEYALLLLSLILRISFAQDAIGQQSPQRQRLRRGLWRQSRVVGGEAAPSGRFPYFVELPNGCGGTLIHDDLVLSAAHCVYGNSNAVLLRTSPRVYVGGVQTKQGQERTISDFRIDPRYHPITEAYDMAIVLLEKPVQNIEAAKVNTDPMFPTDGTTLFVAGYGRTDEDSTTRSTTLQNAVVNYRDDCSTASYGSARFRGYEMMCANSPDYSKDACQGDSGGPLVDPNNVLVGVVSWGEGCANYNKPGVYARVSAASGWIEQQKCEFSNLPPTQCTCTKFSPDCVDIRVDVTYDSYPSETGWAVKNLSNGQVVTSLPAGSITSSIMETISYPILVPAGSYQVEITDNYGDGICCNYGKGSVTIFNGGTETSHPGVFRHETTFPFEVATNVPPVTPPTAAPTPIARWTLRVEILYDWYPEETGWSLGEEATGRQIFSSDAYSIKVPMQPVITDIPGLLSGTQYIFVITDNARDGLCCSYGNGSAKLTVLNEDGSEGAVIWSTDGNFGALETATLTLPRS